MDKNKLKVYEIPFITTITGTILALADSPQAAIDYCNRKLEDASLGLDESNLAEEGFLHDGSVTFKEVKAGEFGFPNEPSLDEIKVNDMNPEEHGDWDAIDHNAEELSLEDPQSPRGNFEADKVE